MNIADYLDTLVMLSAVNILATGAVSVILVFRTFIGR